MAAKAALAAFLVFSTLALSAAFCVPHQPHVDCSSYALSSPDWAELFFRAPELRAAWKAEVANTPTYPPGRFAGRGLVITATKVDMVNIPVALEILQSQGFDLPVEIWYSGEISPEVIGILFRSYRKLGIKNVANYATAEDLESPVTTQGEHVYQAKPLAILNCAFEEVLFLDADNIPMSDPTFLFDVSEYQNTGALFWPDFWQTATTNPIWSILNLKPQGWEQESGQMVVNKKTAWNALNLAFFLAKDATFQMLVSGDKEAFRLAFLATQTPFFMVETHVATAGVMTEEQTFCGHTMVQHDLVGKPLFLHHNSLKHGVAISWEVVKTASGNRFTVVPLPLSTLNGYPTACLDLTGADVSVSSGPFAAFEKVYSQVLKDNDAALKEMSKNEFVSVFRESRRKLLEGNGTLAPGAEACNGQGFTCLASNGQYFLCCSAPCQEYNGNDPVCPGALVAGTTLAPTSVPVAVPASNGACDPAIYTTCNGKGSTFCCPSPDYQCGVDPYGTPSCVPSGSA